MFARIVKQKSFFFFLLNIFKVQGALQGILEWSYDTYTWGPLFATCYLEAFSVSGLMFKASSPIDSLQLFDFRQIFIARF